MGEFDNTVAVITGAARGQGRSHAVALAEQGADIIAVDICADLEAIPYALGTESDLAETVRLVQAAGRKAVPVAADVRDLGSCRPGCRPASTSSVTSTSSWPMPGWWPSVSPTPESEPVFNTIVDTNLKGVWHTLLATVPSIVRKGRGGSVVLVSSSQGLTGRGGDGSAAMFAYAASKHGVVGLMRSAANAYAPHKIRVNSIHPSGSRRR